MAVAFSQKRNYSRVRIRIGLPGARVKNLTNLLPAFISYKQAGMPQISGNMLKDWGESSWSRPSFWGQLYPLLSGMLSADYMPKPSLKITRDLGVLHFRASDYPFNRQKHAHFMRYRWWREAIDKRPVGVKRFKICFVHTHFTMHGDLAVDYAHNLLRHLQRAFSKCTFEIFSDGSVDGDFQLMRQARFLVSPGSSMSIVAAATGTQEVAIIPMSVEDQLRPLWSRSSLHFWPSHMIELPRDAIEHREVHDYVDVAAVEKLLLADGHDETTGVPAGKYVGILGRKLQFNPQFGFSKKSDRGWQRRSGRRGQTSGRASMKNLW
jgi:hypothetical protein